MSFFKVIYSPLNEDQITWNHLIFTFDMLNTFLTIVLQNTGKVLRVIVGCSKIGMIRSLRFVIFDIYRFILRILCPNTHKFYSRRSLETFN